MIKIDAIKMVGADKRNYKNNRYFARKGRKEFELFCEQRLGMEEVDWLKGQKPPFSLYCYPVDAF